jgi:CMP-N,N'-diacetyllegionaminic acid synthase
MSITALIPARSGSKGIPNKNIKPFCGKPLMLWSIEAAQKSSYIDNIILSTDDEHIANIGLAAGASVPFMRPQHLASDKSPTISTVLHILESLSSIQDILLLQPTSPLRTTSDIDEIINLRANMSAESAVSVALARKHPALMYNINTYNSLIPIVNDTYTCRQQFPTVYILNGAMFLASRAFLQSCQAFIGHGTIPYIMPEERSVDIDTSFDWHVAELFMSKNFS